MVRRKEAASEWYTTRGPGWWHGIVDEYKTRLGCTDCGFQSDRAGYFDLDHIDPAAKLMEISRLCVKLRPGNPEDLDLFWAEMEKCRVLCVACHREKTVAERKLAAEKKTAAKRAERRCPHCGEMFTPHHGSQRYCSIGCSSSRRKLGTYPSDDSAPGDGRLPLESAPA